MSRDSTSSDLLEPGPRSRRAGSAPPSIPGYLITEEIGRGAMGIVYHARQTIVDREVALKLLHPEHSSSAKLVGRLQREARTTARLAHPHVVSAIDMGETDGSWWYAMEFVDGPSLAERLKKDGKLTERTALRLFIPLCEALEHLYEHGVVHRDIKPANILIGKTGGARLADLGLAFAEDDPSITGRGGTLGTPHYMSPEQAVDATRADVRSDIWSFGATLFHAVCGSPPFSGKSAAEILSAVLYASIPDPRSLTPELSKGFALILRKCLTRDPDGRYATPGDLLRDLERVRERRAPKVSRGALDPVAQQSHVSRWLVLGGAALLLVILLIALDRAHVLPGFLWGGDGQAETAEVEPGRFSPLEDIAERSERAPRELAQHLADLNSLRPATPAGELSRWGEIRDELRGQLRLAVRSIQSSTEGKLRGAVRGQDYREAQAALEEEFPRRLLERTGLRPEELQQHGLQIASWMERMRGTLDGEVIQAVTDFRDALSDWTSRLNERLDPLLSAHRWDEADALLNIGWDQVLRELDLAQIHLPDSNTEAFRQHLEATLRLQTDRVGGSWRTTDEELARFVRTRSRQLALELETGGAPRMRAGLKLLRAFELELEELGVRREQFPAAAPATCLIVLADRERELVRREEELLEADARLEIEETVELCEELWSLRKYKSIAILWEEVTEKEAILANRVDALWLDELRARSEMWMTEAQLLEEIVLQRAAKRVVRLNGKELANITIGMITLRDKRVKSGLFPLEDGFLVDGFDTTIHLRELSFDQLFGLAGLTEQSELTPRELVALAAFLFHENEFESARQILRKNLDPDLSGALNRLFWSLDSRVAEAVGVRESSERGRAEQASALLAYVFNAEHQAHSPQRVRIHLDTLLNDLADIEEVRAKFRALKVLRESRRADARITVKDALRREFGLEPPEISFPGYKGVRMIFDFTSPLVGAWQAGDWTWDGSGLVPKRKAEGWDDLVYQNGPRLNLSAPLKVEKFQLTIELDEIDDGLPQLLVVSAAGFNVAIAGPGLPGPEPAHRLLVESGRLDDFLERLRAGAGKETPEPLLATSGTHVLELLGNRSTGALKVTLDGRVVWNDYCHPPRLPNPNLQLCAWEMIRLRRLVLDAER